MKKRRLVLAALLSPLVVPVLFLAATVSFSGYLEQGPGHLEKLMLVTMSVCIISYLLSYLGGVPLVLLLNKIDRVTLCYFVMSAVTAGFVGGYVFAVMHSGSGGYNPQKSIIARAAVAGISSGLVALAFGFIAGMPTCRRSAKIVGGKWGTGSGPEVTPQEKL